MVLNPFVDYGSIVYGERFIGREAEISVLRSRTIESYRPACVSIVGLGRIGKSSLAYNALARHQSALLKNNVLICWVNVASLRDHRSVFSYMVKIANETLIAHGVRKSHALGLFEKLLLKLDRLEWVDFIHGIGEAFRALAGEGWKTIFIMDEFDAVRLLFSNDLASFQALRELANRPDTQISYVALSRRPIQKLEELSNAAISNLRSIFQPIYLQPFDENNVIRVLQGLDHLAVEREASLLRSFMKITGGHPYLCNLLAYHIAHTSSQNTDIGQGISEAYPELHDYFETLIAFLDDTEMLKGFLESIRNIHIPSNAKIQRDLVRYGVLQEANNTLRSFSESFEEFALRGISMDKGRKHESAEDNSVQMFISYRHHKADQKSLESLLEYIKPALEREGITVWTDMDIQPGEMWDSTIRYHLSRADIAIALVSQYYLGSRYITDIELPAFIMGQQERGLVVVPIILATCNWQEHSFLRQVQALPRNGKTIRQNYVGQAKRELIYSEILDHLLEYTRKIKNNKSNLGYN